MATKKVGTLIKEARTNADFTQEQLARRISGLSAEDISLAERGKKDLTQEQLKQIAKITGVTQASLINVAKGSSAKKTSSSNSSSVSKTSYMVTAEEKETDPAVSNSRCRHQEQYFKPPQSKRKCDRNDSGRSYGPCAGSVFR